MDKKMNETNEINEPNETNEVVKKAKKSKLTIFSMIAPILILAVLGSYFAASALISNKVNVVSAVNTKGISVNEAKEKLYLSDLSHELDVTSNVYNLNCVRKYALYLDIYQISAELEINVTSSSSKCANATVQMEVNLDTHGRGVTDPQTIYVTLDSNGNANYKKTVSFSELLPVNQLDIDSIRIIGVSK